MEGRDYLIMDDAAPVANNIPPTLLATPLRPALHRATQGLALLLSAVGLALVVRLLIQPDPIQGSWMVQLMLAVAALLAGCWGIIHQYRHWCIPMRRLCELLPCVQRGDAAIEELSGIGEGLSPLIPQVQNLLRELRQQRAANAELELEIRQKVASRTDALERLVGSLRHQATRDPLTGLFNRRFLDQYLPQAIIRAKAEHVELCLLMIDVDNFKLLNDTLGHAAGDDLLKAIGQLIRCTIRGEDVAFRCGGDEFVILLPGYDAVAGRGLADRLVSLVDALVKTIRVAAPPRLSIGVSTLLSTPDRTPEAMLAEADKALYAVKQQRHGGELDRSKRGLSAPSARERGPVCGTTE